MGLRGLAKQGQGWRWAGVLAALWAVGVGLSSPSFAQPLPKIGIVDLQRGLNDSKAGREAKANLQKEKDKRQTLISSKESELIKLQAELNQRGLVLSESVRREKEELYRKTLREYERVVKEANQELAEKEKEQVARILVMLRRHVEEIGKEGGFGVILERNAEAVLYRGESLDLTDEVIARSDRQQVPPPGAKGSK